MIRSITSKRSSNGRTKTGTTGKCLSECTVPNIGSTKCHGNIEEEVTNKQTNITIELFAGKVFNFGEMAVRP